MIGDAPDAHFHLRIVGHGDAIRGAALNYVHFARIFDGQGIGRRGRGAGNQQRSKNHLVGAAAEGDADMGAVGYNFLQKRGLGGDGLHQNRFLAVGQETALEMAKRVSRGKRDNGGSALGDGLAQQIEGIGHISTCGRTAA